MANVILVIELENVGENLEDVLIEVRKALTENVNAVVLFKKIETKEGF